MMGDRKTIFSLDDLALEPMEDEVIGTPVPEGKSNFHIDMRQNKERRQGRDRRQTIRFEKDQRQIVDRRTGSKGWDNTHSRS